MPWTARISGATRMTSWLIWALGVGEHERHALVVALDDEHAVRHDAVLGHAPDRPLEIAGSMPPAESARLTR